MNFNTRILVSVFSTSIVLFYLTTSATSLALGHGHGHGYRQHQHQHHEPQRNQVQRHIHQAYHRYLASRSAASSTSTSAPKSPVFISEYRNSSKVIIIPITEIQNTYDFLGVKEGMLFFTEVNDSSALEFAFRNLKHDKEDELEADSNGWKVKKEKNMMFRYWFMVWFIPALLLGI